MSKRQRCVLFFKKNLGTLMEERILDGQKLLFEERLPDGKWPKLATKRDREFDARSMV